MAFLPKFTVSVSDRHAVITEYLSFTHMWYSIENSEKKSSEKSREEQAPLDTVYSFFVWIVLNLDGQFDSFLYIGICIAFHFPIK